MQYNCEGVLDSACLHNYIIIKNTFTANNLLMRIDKLVIVIIDIVKDIIN